MAHAGLGFALFKEGKLAEAEAHYREALRLKPDFVPAYSNLGLVRLKEGKLAEAEAQYREALRREPENAMARRDLGLVLYKQGRLEEAITALSEALRREPDNEATRGYLGAALFMQGRLDEAEGLFRGLLAGDPDMTDALNNLAWLLALRDQGKAQEALERIDHAIEVAGPSPDLLSTRSVVLIRAGQLDRALIDLEGARAVAPRNPSLAVHLAWACQASGRIDEARKAFQQAKDLGWTLAATDPLERPFLDELGRALTR
jgi:tetratricopeptide (TPR) repeat protein